MVKYHTQMGYELKRKAAHMQERFDSSKRKEDLGGKIRLWDHKPSVQYHDTYRK